MNNQEESSTSNQPAKTPNENWVIGCVRKIERNFQEHRASKKSETPQDRAARRTANATWWIAAFTFVAVGVGISQAIIANRTLVAISGQLTEMQSSSAQVERSIAASNRIADESKTANALTGEANRPWIGFSELIVTPPDIFGKAPLTITISITNAGRSPALVTSIKCASDILEKSPVDPVYNLTPAQIAMGSQVFLVPGQRTTCPQKREPLSPLAIGRLRLSAGSIAFYVYAEILYTDVSSGLTHLTHTCQVFRPSADIWAGCPTYNSAK